MREGNAVRMKNMGGELTGPTGASQVARATQVAQGLSVWQLAKILFRTLWRAIRQLFHEITGALFATFALSGGFSIWRQFQNQNVRLPWLTGLTVFFTLLMAFFSWIAFRSARNVR